MAHSVVIEVHWEINRSIGPLTQESNAFNLRTTENSRHFLLKNRATQKKRPLQRMTCKKLSDFVIMGDFVKVVVILQLWHFYTLDSAV